MRDTSPGPSPNLDDIRWLVGAEAAGVLEQAMKLSGSLVSRLTKLRAQLSPERAHRVLEQVELRSRAREKFAAAERMFFTPRGLEQATDEIVARYKARRFEGRSDVFDLCCGIGGDLLALARVGATTGYDRDPVSAVLAEANAQRLGLDGVQLRAEDVTQIDLSQCQAWHIDPDRRPHGERTTRVEWHEPSAEALERMLDKNPNAAIKLAPAASWPDTWNPRAEWEWISRGRQCRQLVAWFGDLAIQPGSHRATLLDNAGNAFDCVGLPDDEVPRADRIERYVFEPDVSVLAAKLHAAFAARHQLGTIAPGVAYWTGPQPINDPLLACFEVEIVLPLDIKKLKSLLRERNVGVLEVKVRGVDQNPAELRTRLAPRGSESRTLLITRLDKQVTVILARRVVPSSETTPGAETK